MHGSAEREPALPCDAAGPVLYILPTRIRGSKLWGARPGARVRARAGQKLPMTDLSICFVPFLLFFLCALSAGRCGITSLKGMLLAGYFGCLFLLLCMFACGYTRSISRIISACVSPLSWHNLSKSSRSSLYHRQKVFLTGISYRFFIKGLAVKRF